MKKLFSILLVTAFLLSIGTTSVFAACAPCGIKYADDDNNGIYDICEGRDADGDGLYDSCPNVGKRLQYKPVRRGWCENICIGAIFADTDGGDNTQDLV